jgi:hypothetical protein
VALFDCAEEFVTLEFEHHEFLLTLKLKRCGYLPAFSHSFTTTIIIIIIVVINIWHAGTTFLGYCHNKIKYYADRQRGKKKKTFLGYEN